MSEFFAMGGYAAYVWGSYGTAALVLVVLLVASLRGLRQNQAVLTALEAAQPSRRRRREVVESQGNARTLPAGEGSLS